MTKTTANKPSVIYIEQVENLHIDHFELASTHIYIEKVENLHIGKTELASTDTSYYKQPPEHHQSPTSPTLTNSQLALAFHYVLKSLGLYARVNIDIASIARFIHAVTGKTYTRIHNSEFYKKLQRVPNSKTDRELIKDLAVVRSVLSQVELKEAALMVDNEIILARQEINLSSK